MLTVWKTKYFYYMKVILKELWAEKLAGSGAAFLLRIKKKQNLNLRKLDKWPEDTRSGEEPPLRPAQFQ